MTSRDSGGYNKQERPQLAIGLQVHSSRLKMLLASIEEYTSQHPFHVKKHLLCNVSAILTGWSKYGTTGIIPTSVDCSLCDIRWLFLTPLR